MVGKTHLSERSQYFESVLQLRNVNKDILKMVKDAVAKEKRVFITKRKKVKGGVDLYVTSKKFTSQIGTKLKRHFGGQFMISPTLFSEKKGKLLYRTAVLFRALDFEKGDVIKAGNKIILVKNLGKNVVGTDLKLGKSVNVELKRITPEKLKVFKVVVSKHRPEMEVLHPETYESTKVANKKATTKSKVRIVIVDSKLYAF